jgi:DNA-binding transcriptional LysR family regulator
MLDVYELNVFLTAAETENFSEAARQLHLTQPAVSMQIRALEKKLDVDLFHRTGRTLALTEQGRALMPLAREVINRAIQIEEELESLKGEVVGHLKLGCSTSTGKYILPNLVARFRRCHPRVQITIYNHSRTAVLTELEEGAIQLAVISSQPGGVDVVCRHFFTDHVVLIVPADHAWSRLDCVPPEALQSVPFILRDTQSGTRQEVEGMLEAVNISVSDLNLAMEIGNSEAISMAVEEGIGVAFVSRTVARRGIELGKLKEVRVADVSLQREVFIAYSRRHPATRAQMEFWNFIQEPENQELLKLAA